MRTVVAAVALLLAATASPAQSPADLFPPGTLAYAEVRGPALADGLAALVKGTPWADSLASLPDALDRVAGTGDEAEVRETAALALFTAPEALAELRRTRGAAAGLLGFSPKGRPRYAAALLTGDSALAALAVRQRLTADASLRRVASLGAVAVFQRRGPTPPTDAEVDGPPEPAKPFPPGDDEPTFATLPGLLVVASDLDAVRDVLERFKSPAKSPSLAALAAFKLAREAVPAGGVGFLYATPAAYLAASDRVRAPGSPDPLGVARFLLDLPRWSTVTGHLALADDRVELTVHADFDKLPPLAEALTGPALPADDQARIRRRYLSDVALTVPPGDGRAGRWLALADAVAAGRGQLGRKPSRLAADLDRAAGKGTTVAELLGSVAGVSVGYGIDGPVAVAHLDGSPAAGRWAAELPRLLPELLGPSAGVSSEATAAGRTFTLQWGDEAARSRLTVATTPQAIYATADPVFLSHLQNTPPAATVGVPKSRGVVQVPTALLRLNLLNPPVAPPAPPAEGGVFLVPGGRGGQLVLDDAPVPPPPAGPSATDVLDLLFRRLRPLPMLSADVAALPASPNRVTVTVRLPDAKAALRRLFDLPKPVPAGPGEKDAEKPVPAERP